MRPLRPCRNERECLKKTRLFPWFSSNFEVEGTWTSLIGWLHKTSNIGICYFSSKKQKNRKNRKNKIKFRICENMWWERTKASFMTGRNENGWFSSRSATSFIWSTEYFSKISFQQAFKLPKKNNNINSFSFNFQFYAVQLEIRV